MYNNFNRIEHLGFDQWFQDQVDLDDWGNFTIARVMAVHKEKYKINWGEQDVPAELVGKMLYSAASPLDFPAVGDWVIAMPYDENTFSIIHQVLPRRSLLKRKTPGKKIAFQLIAANLDTALIVQSLDEDFNLARLERYLVMVNEGNIQPVVLLSKSDLLPAVRVNERISAIQQLAPGLTVHAFSNQDVSDLGKVKQLFQPGRTYCLLGSSGVGKTTLVNNLLGEAVYKTLQVREKDSKGRHSTSARQLIQLDNGAMLIDTPGMRELGVFSVESGLDETFADIYQLAQDCQFSDCTHINEKGCAVLEAVADGRLVEARYKNFLKMHKESDYYELSYLEKRQKDKRQGKFYKSVMKHKEK